MTARSRAGWVRGLLVKVVRTLARQTHRSFVEKGLLGYVPCDSHAAEIIRHFPEDSELRLKHFGFSFDLSNAVDPLATSNALNYTRPHIK